MFGKKKEVCIICQKNAGSKKIADGMICEDCFSKCAPYVSVLNLKNTTKQRIVDGISAKQENDKRSKIYSKTQNVEKLFEIDENNKFWMVPKYCPSVVFSYSDIAAFELLENGEAVSKGGLGRAVVGGVLFGGVGAIVGAGTGKRKTKQEITEYRIKIVTRNSFFPEIYIDFLSGTKVKSGSFVYNAYVASAQKILSLLTLMVEQVDTKENNQGSVSAADEILKFKKLLDDGIITQEEFDRKKAQLLDL